MEIRAIEITRNGAMVIPEGLSLSNYFTKPMVHLKDTDTGNIIVIGDRVLIKPTTPAEKTEGGLYLPQGMHKTEELRTGYVIKVGPGYPIPVPPDDEPWKEHNDEVRYVPLQPKQGDLAVYIQKNVFNIRFNGEDYVIAPHGAILMVVREED